MTTRADRSRRRVVAVLDRIDTRIDRIFDPWRGRPLPDIAAAAVSTISDHGLVWVVVAGYRARLPGPARRRALGGLALAGCSSFVVNRAVKRAVGRARPDVQPATPEDRRSAPRPGLEGLLVRAPTSSSFPSGHTLAATCAALTLGTDATGTVALGTVALGVAVSRVHLRHHHPSDVLGGLLIGGALAAVTRPLAGWMARRRTGPDRSPQGRESCPRGGGCSAHGASRLRRDLGLSLSFRPQRP